MWIELTSLDHRTRTKCASLSEEWLPRVSTLYYIHNFRGTKVRNDGDARPRRLSAVPTDSANSLSQFGSLFRCYPGEWQVFRRTEGEPGSATLIASFESRPTLADVAEIIRQS